MKYVIEIFENGVRTDVLVADDKYDLDGYFKLFSDIKGSYVKKGYYTVKGSATGEHWYNVLFNEDEMKSVVVYAKFRTESDFVDADGQPIILSKLYRSEENGDRYSINKGSMAWEGRLYLRNADKCDSHIEIVDGSLWMSRTVDDKYDFDQKFIDSLKLHREKDKIV